MSSLGSAVNTVRFGSVANIGCKDSAAANTVHMGLMSSQWILA